MLNIFDVSLQVEILHQGRERQSIPGSRSEPGRLLPLHANETVSCRNFGSVEAAGGSMVH